MYCSLGIFDKAFRSWWVIGTSSLQMVDFPTSTSQLADFSDKDFAVGGFF